MASKVQQASPRDACLKGQTACKHIGLAADQDEAGKAHGRRGRSQVTVFILMFPSGRLCLKKKTKKTTSCGDGAGRTPRGSAGRTDPPGADANTGAAEGGTVVAVLVGAVKASESRWELGDSSLQLEDFT